MENINRESFLNALEIVDKYKKQIKEDLDKINKTQYDTSKEKYKSIKNEKNEIQTTLRPS